MIISELVKAYERLAQNPKTEISRNGYCYDKVSFFVVLTNDGRLKEIVENPSKTVERVIENSKKNTAEAWYLYDSADYLLGLEYDAKGKQWVESLDSSNAKKRESGEDFKTKFDLFKEKNLEFLADVDSDMARAIVAFLHTFNPVDNLDNPLLFSGAGTSNQKPLKLEGRCAFVLRTVAKKSYEDEAILRQWDKLFSAPSKDAVFGRCLVYGEIMEIAKNHKPIRFSGPQGKDAYLVSVDKGSASFQSYGKLEGFNSPISVEAMDKYTATLNYFYRVGSKNKRRICDQTLIFWGESDDPRYEEAVGERLHSASKSDDGEITAVEGEVDSSLDLLRQGISPAEIGLEDNVRFHILIITPNVARLSVTRYYNTTFGSIKSNIEQHERDMYIEIGRSRRQIPIWAIADATVSSSVKPQNRSKEAEAAETGLLMDAMLNKNIPYPASVYTKMISRILTDSSVPEDDPKKKEQILGLTKIRIAYVKAYLVRKGRIEKNEEDKFMSLNKDCEKTAYLLGRLFAVLEKIQKDAIEGINSTIKDRFFSTACDTPAQVFPTLLKNSNHHLAKLENGAKYYKILMREIIDKVNLTSLPKQHNSDEQGSFLLGYYHQNSDFYKSREKKDGDDVTN